MSIRTRTQSQCLLCGTRGQTLHQGLKDRRYAVPGEWRVMRCPGCELAWLNPRPVHEDMGRAYEGYYTHSGTRPPAGLPRRLHWALTEAHLRRFGYRGASAFWHPLLAVMAWAHPGGGAELGREVMYLSAPSIGALLLEVGCGNGEFLAGMRQRGWTVAGVDVDPEAAEVARARGLEVWTGELHHLQFPADIADAVVLSHVIEHVHDPVGLLSECRRVLKPGGQLVVTSPNSDSLGHRRFGADWWPLDPPRHLVLFNTATLRTAAERAGLSVRRLTTTARGARSVWSQSALIARSGRVDVSHVPGLRSHLMGLPFQVWERLRTWLGRTEGEELLLIATKT